MSKVLLRLFQFFHPAFFFCFSSILICWCFHSVLCRISLKRGHQENESHDGSSDVSNEKNSAGEEDLIADVLNGETLLFLPYKVDKSLAVDEIREVSKVHEVICNSNSVFPEEYNPNDADEEDIEDTKITVEGRTEFIEESEVPREAEEPEVKNDGDNGDEDGKTGKREREVKEGGLGSEGGKDGFMEMVQLTAETTLKNSWEWRSSTNYRDSEMEDQCSSSTSSSADSLFIKKYDEEMMFYDKISALKLQETESFRTMNPLPRSVSKRIMVGLKGYVEETQRLGGDVSNPQQELEAAYVAQICLTWEALNWNYKNLKKLMSAKEHAEFGHYAHVAQQLQQFQVLLRRFIEIEPYEHGCRPEIYARMRISRPKLLQVPELREGNVEGMATEETKISTAELLELMEDSIKIFMEFLNAEKEEKCAIFRTMCRRLRSNADSSRIRAVRKAARKKRKELKEMQGRWRWLTRKSKLNRADQFEVLLASIDVKVALRVSKLARLNEEQLHWCEQKIDKLMVDKDKIQRDSCPLFYPFR
ncbi:unnamed protein product [Victoria cruziana]